MHVVFVSRVSRPDVDLSTCHWFSFLYLPYYILISRSIFISPECYKYRFCPGHKNTNSANNIVDCQPNRGVLIQRGTEADKLCGRPATVNGLISLWVFIQRTHDGLGLSLRSGLGYLVDLMNINEHGVNHIHRKSDQVSVKMMSISTFRIKILEAG